MKAQEQTEEQSAPAGLTDREIVELFLRRGLRETSDFTRFWGYFSAAMTRELNQMPSDGAGFKLKSMLASYWISGLRENFFQGQQTEFFWQPGKLRQMAFRLGQEHGVHMMPVHFYTPIPDTRTLPEGIWKQASEWPGVRPNAEKQLELAAEFTRRFKNEYEAIPFERPAGAPPYTYHASNTFYASIDGYVLYSMIRQFKPRRIIEVGSGNTTYLSAQAIAKNQSEDDNCQCELTAIEPNPNEVLRAGFPGLTRLIVKQVQEVPLAEFEQLRENDILFIDSSHVLKIGSDVKYEILEILPRLKKGVIVHFHDIFMPREYPKDWVMDMNRYYTEQYILQAFLAFNDSFEVLFATPYLHTHHPEALEAMFRCYRRGQEWIPANFWMRRTR